MAEACAICGYERPPADERARRIAADLTRSNPMSYPPDVARAEADGIIERGAENCGACGAPWVTAA